MKNTFPEKPCKKCGAATIPRPLFKALLKTKKKPGISLPASFSA